MPHDPYPMLTQCQRIHTSKEMLGTDLDLTCDRSPIRDPDFYLVLHWGGGPNSAGWPIEEPAATLPQKLLIQLGRCKTVLRSWHAYHKSKGWCCIGYSTAIDPLYGQITKLRGHKTNAGQWGTINTITHAVVFIMGLGQTASKRAWQSLGMLWFCAGGPRLVGHRFFNDWPQTLTTTSCPGDLNSDLIAAEHHITALGTLRFRKVGRSRGRRVRAVSLKLTELGMLDGRKSRMGLAVQEAVAHFQQTYFVEGDPPGVVGPNTWKALAQA